VRMGVSALWADVVCSMARVFDGHEKLTDFLKRIKARKVGLKSFRFRPSRI
jgi:hypothetical protein